MKKTSVDLILSIVFFIGYFFTGLLALPFIAGILFGDYLIAKYNWLGLGDTEDEPESTWASQFEINKDELNQNENE